MSVRDLVPAPKPLDKLF